MLKIEKRIDENGYYTFSFKTIDGTFEISFQNNLDLYWRYVHESIILEEPDTKEFFITKENYQIYSIFEKLYNSIKDSNPYSGYTFITPISYYHKALERDEAEKVEVPINPHPNYLYRNGIITWASDDFSSQEKASNFKIERQEDEFKITFKKSEVQRDCGMYFPTYSVRIRNSGSRYNPYNIAFMKMYQDLKDYEPTNQIHIEEYLYECKKLAKTKN